MHFDRNLAPPDRGEDVRELQEALVALGFSEVAPDGAFGPSTYEAVREVQARHGLPPTGVVNPATARTLGVALAARQREGFSVSGQVLAADGNPMADGVVTLNEKRLRSEPLIARATLERDGRFRIDYPEPEARPISLILHVMAADGSPLATSDVICDAGPDEEVTILVGGPGRDAPAEFPMLERLLRPILREEDLAPADLTEDDLALLDCRLDVERALLSAFADSARLASAARIDRSASYGLVRQGMAPRLPALLSETNARLQARLEAAASGSQIDLLTDEAVAELLRRVADLRFEQAFAASERPDENSLADLMTVAGISRAGQERIVAAFLEHEGDPQAFWDGLVATGTVDENTVGRAQVALQIGALTRNHVPLVERLLERHEPATAADLVALSRSDWLDLIHDTGIPTGLPGATEADRETLYATVIEAGLEQGHPAAFLGARLGEDADGFVGRDDVARFLSRNPDFDLDRDRVDAFLEARGAAALDGIANPAELPATLRSVTRIAALGGPYRRHEIVAPLMRAGVTSAHAIARMGSAFTGRFAGELGTSRAKSVVEAARQRSALATALYANFSPTMHHALPQAVGPAAVAWHALLPTAPDLPDWSTLFGSGDACACEECRSIYGPAAYLVDLLAFVEDHGALGALTAAGRRPDLLRLELTCENVDTPLPYIDLVNEVLAEAVAPGGGPTPQTTAPAEELRARPEHETTAADAVLAGAVYPWDLPFSRSAAEARALLDHLAIPRHRLMSNFLSEGAADPAESAAVIAAERLNLAPLDRALVTGAASVTQTLQELWGHPGDTIPELRDHLVRPSRMMRTARIGWNDLNDLLATRFVSPTDTVEIAFEDDRCDLDFALIEPMPSEAMLDRIHRFDRLRRRTGWPVHELDRALTALAGSGLDDTVLVGLAGLAQLREDLRAPLEDLLTWWAPIGIRDHAPQSGEAVPSLYARVFQNAVAFDPDEIVAFALDGTDLANAGNSLAPHLPALAAALGVSVERLDALAGQGATLDLATLSALYRTISLAEALSLGLEDLAVLRALSPNDPFASPAEAISFVKDTGTIRDAGLTIAEVDYLLRQRDRPGAPVAPGDRDLASILLTLRTAQRDIRTRFTVAPDPDGALTEAALVAIHDSATVTRAMELIREGTFDPAGDLDAFLADVLPFLDPVVATDMLVGTGGAPPSLSPETEGAERFAFVLSTLVHHLHAELSRDATAQALAAAFNIPTGMLATLLGPAAEAFETEALLDDAVPITRAALPAAFAALGRLWKSALIARTLDLDVDEAAFLVGRAEALDVLDISALPETEPPEAEWPELFGRLQRLVTLVAAHRGLPRIGAGLFGVMVHAFDVAPADTDAARSALLEALHRLTGWPLETLTFLAGEDGLALPFPASFASGQAVARIRTAAADLGRLGLSSPNVIPEVIAPEITPESARIVRNAAKSKYDRTQWLSVAGGINDVVRKRQRDALMAHLLATRSTFDTAADLFGHYLIDPEMSACQLTSRTRQAIVAVQTFVQRALLNLEPDVDLPPEATDAWEWMRQFRIHGANRMVFVEPENYLEPALRRDKTPLFRDLETALASSDASEADLEAAVAGYVRGLAEIARPEMSAIYREGPENRSRLHLFARTREYPQRYMHRHRVGDAPWSPWEPIPLDIEGEHLIPATMGRHFYLFWPVFTEETKPPTTEGQNAKDILRMRLAWSQWQDGSWSAKRLSKTSVELPNFKPNLLYFRAVQRFGEPLSHGDFEGSGGGGTEPLNFDSTPRKIAVRILPLPNLEGLGGKTLELARFWMSSTGEIESERLFDAALMTEPLPLAAYPDAMAMRETVHDPLVLPSADTDYFGNAVISTLSSVDVLGQTPGRFRIVAPHQFEGFASQGAFTFEDDQTAFVVQPIKVNDIFQPGGGGLGGGDLPITVGIRHTHSTSPADVGTVFPATLANVGLALEVEQPETPEAVLDLVVFNPFHMAGGGQGRTYLFQTHYHPHASDYLATIHSKGVGALLGNLDKQPTGGANFFANRYDPVPNRIAAPHPRAGTDFAPNAAYSTYNWELFVHVPLLIAERLRRDRRFELAQKWYHYIFDPTRLEGPAPRGYWKVRPFFDYDLTDPDSLPVQQMMRALAEGDMGLANQVRVWRENPFDPHAVARLRTIAYQKSVVMKYLDNLIEWADHLFQQDTFETVSEALQLYLLASEILGPRPERIDTGVRPEPQTYESVAADLDAFSNALVEIEEQLGPNGMLGPQALTIDLGGASTSAPQPLATTLLFCVPPNRKLLGYWDTIADRLFKIRNCLNIEGQERQLALFEPPIDPALLVKAQAAGVDLTTALQNMNAPMPHYRFSALLETALAAVEATKGLGASLLDALSQRDGEAIALLRAGHETEILKTIRQIKEEQIAEAEEQRDGLKRSRDTVSERQVHYENLPDRIEEEEMQLSAREAAGRSQGQALDRDLVSADAARFIPDFSLGWSGLGPLASASLGRANILAFFQFRSQEKRADAIRSTHTADLDSIRGGWLRRGADWEFSANQAKSELRQIDRQIAAAEIRIETARADLVSHLRRTEQAAEIERVMADKYTDAELHDWRAAQISSLYFQSYNLSYNLAKRAERAYRHALGTEDAEFIEFGNWDNLRRGLLAGERLEMQLRRMGAAFMERNRREYELTSYVSLAQLNPLALLRLQQEGRCEIDLPEWYFDRDRPGDYFRRIKTVQLTVSGVTGPNVSVNVTLRLLQSSVRRTGELLDGVYDRTTDGDDPRFHTSFGAVQSIATSTGRGDGGLFELNFGDPRLLPFEGMGAISRWRLEMPAAFRQFDYSSITDVVMTLLYTARDGGEGLRQAAEGSLLDRLNAAASGPDAPGLVATIGARHEAPTEFARFLRPTVAGAEQTMVLDLSPRCFPYHFRHRTISINAVRLVIVADAALIEPDGTGTVLGLAAPDGTPLQADFTGAERIGGALAVTLEGLDVEPGPWTITVLSAGGDLADTGGQLDATAVHEIALLVHYTVSSSQ